MDGQSNHYKWVKTEKVASRNGTSARIPWAVDLFVYYNTGI